MRRHKKCYYSEVLVVTLVVVAYYYYYCSSNSRSTIVEYSKLGFMQFGRLVRFVAPGKKGKIDVHVTKQRLSLQAVNQLEQVSPALTLSSLFKKILLSLLRGSLLNPVQLFEGVA